MPPVNVALRSQACAKQLIQSDCNFVPDAHFCKIVESGSTVNATMPAARPEICNSTSDMGEEFEPRIQGDYFQAHCPSACNVPCIVKYCFGEQDPEDCRYKRPELCNGDSDIAVELSANCPILCGTCPTSTTTTSITTAQKEIWEG